MIINRAKLALTWSIPAFTLLVGCAAMEDEKAHQGEEVYPGVKVAVFRRAQFRSRDMHRYRSV